MQSEPRRAGDLCGAHHEALPDDAHSLPEGGDLPARPGFLGIRRCARETSFEIVSEQIVRTL